MKISSFTGIRISVCVVPEAPLLIRLLAVIVAVSWWGWPIGRGSVTSAKLTSDWSSVETANLRSEAAPLLPWKTATRLLTIASTGATIASSFFIATTVASASASVATSRVLSRSLVELRRTLLGVLLAVPLSRKLISMLPESLDIPVELWCMLVKMLVSVSADAGVEDACGDAGATS